MEKEVIDIDSTSDPPSSSPLHIKRPNNEYIIRPPHKGFLSKSSYNMNPRASQHYSIFKYLAQAPSIMSSLKVLQTCPVNLKSLFSAIGGIDLADSNLITFNI